MLGREFELYPSRRFLVLFCLVSVISGISLAVTSISLLYKLPLTILLIVYTYHIYQQFGSLNANTAVRGIECHPEGGWLVNMPHSSQRAVLRGDSVVTSVVTLLRFQCQQEKRSLSCLIFPDSLAPDLYRQLLVAVCVE